MPFSINKYVIITNEINNIKIGKCKISNVIKPSKTENYLILGIQCYFSFNIKQRFAIY